MIDPNTKTDYNKMRKLIQLDRLDGDRKGIIRKIAETGQIITRLEETFPARMITNPQIFPSLLFYYGMLTINGTFGSQLVWEFLIIMFASNIMAICWKSIRMIGMLICLTWNISLR